mgnify:CR=1 FL=1
MRPTEADFFSLTFRNRLRDMMKAEYSLNVTGRFLTYGYVALYSRLWRVLLSQSF